MFYAGNGEVVFEEWSNNGTLILHSFQLQQIQNETKLIYKYAQELKTSIFHFYFTLHLKFLFFKLIA